MTKEELIALSDLNREDNIKYISSEAQGIAITLDSDRYAPTLCKLERAYICGRRKSEEQIEQLEKENSELKVDNDARKFAMAMSEKVEKQLREENADLDCQKNRNKYCYSCANATERCFRNEIGCPCEKYKSYKDENAELKKNYEDLKEFYEKEYFEIADKTANERIKELEQYETEITVDDYSPYDENTWGMMHEEIFVPKNLVIDMLKENYAYTENLKKENAELKNRDCWKSCEYANPKAELIGQHIKDVQNINKAKDLLK